MAGRGVFERLGKFLLSQLSLLNNNIVDAIELFA